MLPGRRAFPRYSARSGLGLPISPRFNWKARGYVSPVGSSPTARLTGKYRRAYTQWGVRPPCPRPTQQERKERKKGRQTGNAAERAERKERQGAWARDKRKESRKKRKKQRPAKALRWCRRESDGGRAGRRAMKASVPTAVGAAGRPARPALGPCGPCQRAPSGHQPPAHPHGPTWPARPSWRCPTRATQRSTRPSGRHPTSRSTSQPPPITKAHSSPALLCLAASWSGAYRWCPRARPLRSRWPLGGCCGRHVGGGHPVAEHHQPQRRLDERICRSDQLQRVWVGAHARVVGRPACSAGRRIADAVGASACEGGARAGR